MTVVTPAVYQALAERGLGPRLEPRRGFERLPVRFQVVRALFAANLAVALRPKSVRHLATQGGTGVALFEEEELQAFVSEAEEGSPDRPTEGRWWEFWPTSDGGYAMFPGDDAGQASIAGTVWIPAEGAAHVRRVEFRSLLRLGRPAPLTMGAPTSDDQPGPRDQPPVPPEPCELRAEETEPGAPYVGRCANQGCAGGCSPHVLICPDDGIQRLLECNC